MILLSEQDKQYCLKKNNRRLEEDNITWKWWYFKVLWGLQDNLSYLYGVTYKQIDSRNIIINKEQQSCQFRYI